MDNVTHAALGIAAGIVVRRQGCSLPAAAVAGLLAAEAPDLDVFIRQTDDPLVAFRWHRHFTHSFAFLAVWAALTAGIVAGLFHWRGRHPGPWTGLLLPAAAGTLTHLLCDNCTSYGTMLLWPFSEARFSWDCLPIIDLFATLPLLVLAILAWRRHAPRLAAYGLLWFSAYALAGVWQQRRAEQGVRAWLATRGVAPAKLAVKPTISNLLAWRAIWLHEGRWQVAVVRLTPFGGRQLLLGETRAAWTPESAGNPPSFSPGAHVITDFSVFTQGWNTYDREDGAILVGDIRFAMLPTSSRPLWSVRCGPGGTPEETSLKMDRRLDDGDWGRLLDLLTGADPRYFPIP